MSKKRYLVSKDAPAETAAIFARQEHPVKAGEETELDLTYREEQAMVAAGWIEEAKEEKKGGKS